MLSKIRTQAETGREKDTKSLKIGHEMAITTGRREDEREIRSVDDLLHRIEVFLTAMAIAGVTPLYQLDGGLPKAVARGEDTTSEVICPLDVVQRLFWRIKQRVREILYAAQFGWISANFQSEQKFWVGEIAKSSKTIGEVIRDSLIQRESLWQLPPASLPPPARDHHLLSAMVQAEKARGKRERRLANQRLSGAASQTTASSGVFSRGS